MATMRLPWALRAVVLAAAGCAMLPTGAVAQGTAATDRVALEALYDATGGADWTDSTNWKTDAPPGDWFGVTTDADGRVTALYLGGNELAGPVPASLGTLTNLRHLDLSWNDLSGSIPGELGRLASLEVLYLDRNELTGPIPASLGSLTNLEILYVTWNDLSGLVPAALGRLENLWALDLSYNWGLSGPLPPGLQLPGLEHVDIFVTQTCAPVVWRLPSIRFRGRPCDVDMGTEVTIDVAVVYTPAVRAALGGTAAVEAEIDLMVAETNQGYAASGVHQRLELVERSEVAYDGTGDLFIDIDRLVDPADGYLDDVHALRDRFGADLVHLMVNEFGGIAGIADLGGPFSAGVYSGLRADGSRTGGPGLFAHELGHNMGLFHDRYQALGEEHRGAAAHPAFGYVNQRALEADSPASSRWFTRMAYGTQCSDADFFCNGLLRFSNPRQSYRGDPMGVPYGTGETGLTGPADAAAVLNATGPAVASWRDRPGGDNRPPTAAGTLPDRELTLPGTLDVDVSQAFADLDGDTLTYAVSSSAPRVVTVSAADARVMLTAVGVGTAMIRVTATDPGGLSAAQAFTVTVLPVITRGFTDDPIRPGVTPVRARHFTELRNRIDALREAAGLGRFRWTDPALQVGVTPVRLVHMTELRSALAGAYTAAGRSVPRWTDPAPVRERTPIRAAHLMELRAAVVALE